MAVNQKQLRDMLNELLVVEDGLSDWEIRFVENLKNWDGDFRERQAWALEKIWDKHLGRAVTHN